MQIDLNTLVKAAGKIADAIAGDEDITIRHSGLVAKAPYAGNEDKTVSELFAEYGPRVGIGNGARPSITRPGEGSVDAQAKVTPGVYEAFTDKKENA